MQEMTSDMPSRQHAEMGNAMSSAVESGGSQPDNSLLLPMLLLALPSFPCRCHSDYSFLIPAPPPPPQPAAAAAAPADAATVAALPTATSAISHRNCCSCRCCCTNGRLRSLCPRCCCPYQNTFPCSLLPPLRPSPAVFPLSPASFRVALCDSACSKRKLSFVSPLSFFPGENGMGTGVRFPVSSCNRLTLTHSLLYQSNTFASLSSPCAIPRCGSF
ncbi:unnamed protein product [Closterium sp. NIES-54]